LGATLPLAPKIGLIATTLLCGVSCNSKLDVKANRGAPLPAEEEPTPETPAEPDADKSDDPDQAKQVDDGFARTRYYYQSRSIVTLKLTPDGVPAGSMFSLINDSTKTTLVEDETLAAREMAAGTSFGLTEQGYDIILRLYPLTTAMKGHFRYGKNALRLLANDGGQVLESTTNIFISDFDIQGLETVAAAEEADQLDLWMNPTSRVTVSNETSLTVGVGNIVND
jgi:hypothetical protein